MFPPLQPTSSTVETQADDILRSIVEEFVSSKVVSDVNTPTPLGYASSGPIIAGAPLGGSEQPRQSTQTGDVAVCTTRQSDASGIFCQLQNTYLGFCTGVEDLEEKYDFKQALWSLGPLGWKQCERSEYAVVWCGVVCRRRCYQMAMARMPCIRVMQNRRAVCLSACCVQCVAHL